MEVTTDDLRGIEQAHVKAWPAFETANIDGWLWRYSGGGSQRANSVSTLHFTGSDPDAALDAVEARYRAKGAPARLHTFDLSLPANLPALLNARGYGQGDATLTMAKPVSPGKSPADVAIEERATPPWYEIYLGAITENRRAVNAKILDTIPRPRAFFTCRRDTVISTALGVTDGKLAVIECVATRSDFRRGGGARAVLAALECWAGEQGARLLGLQVDATNEPALTLYRSLGFVAVATNRFWMRSS
jgi:ribosomal protein S18 acetylase RimI-like enzyme